MPGSMLVRADMVLLELIKLYNLFVPHGTPRYPEVRNESSN